MLFDKRALPLKLHVGRAVLERGARLSTEDLNNLLARSFWHFSSCNLYCTVSLSFLGNLEKLFVGAIDQSVRWCRHNGIFERGEQVPGGRFMSSHQFLLWLGVDQTVTVTNTGVRGEGRGHINFWCSWRNKRACSSFVAGAAMRSDVGSVTKMTPR